MLRSYINFLKIKLNQVKYKKKKKNRTIRRKFKENVIFRNN